MERSSTGTREPAGILPDDWRMMSFGDAYFVVPHHELAGGEVVHRFGRFDEWYRDRDTGLEHGFTIDEPLATLGTALKLPAQYESQRAAIEAHLPPPEVAEIHRVLVGHLNDLYSFYGEYTGVRVARKHISWYTKGLAGSASFRHAMNQLQTCAEQLDAVNIFFGELASQGPRLTYVEELAA